MRSLTLAIAGAILAGCARPHVTGSRATEQPCNGDWIATVVNNTDRIYDLYVGTRLVGSADQRSTTRIRIDPALGTVRPSYRESATTRDHTGPRITNNAIRMTCE